MLSYQIIVLILSALSLLIGWFCLAEARQHKRATSFEEETVHVWWNTCGWFFLLLAVVLLIFDFSLAW